jgi:hypothetical protein
MILHGCAKEFLAPMRSRNILPEKHGYSRSSPFS